MDQVMELIDKTLVDIKAIARKPKKASSKKKNAQKQYKMLMNFMKIYESQKQREEIVGELLAFGEDPIPEVPLTPNIQNLRNQSMILPRTEPVVPTRRRAASRQFPLSNTSQNTEVDENLWVCNSDDLLIAYRLKTGVYQCNTCPKRENSKEEIEKHHRSVHVGEYVVKKARQTRRSLGLQPRM